MSPDTGNVIIIGIDRTDWEQVDRLTDEEVAAAVVADPDAGPPTDDAFWAEAELVLPHGKEAISLRVDTDVMASFRAQGQGFQTRMNAVLRQYVEAQKRR